MTLAVDQIRIYPHSGEHWQIIAPPTRGKVHCVIVKVRRAPSGHEYKVHSVNQDSQTLPASWNDWEGATLSGECAAEHPYKLEPILSGRGFVPVPKQINVVTIGNPMSIAKKKPITKSAKKTTSKRAPKTVKRVTKKEVNAWALNDKKTSKHGSKSAGKATSA